MPGDPRDRIVHYLREALADELSLARTLRSHVIVAARGPYRTGLEGYLHETREHARRLDRRLTELGAGRGALRSGASTVRNVLAWGRGPLNAIRRHSPEERLLRGAKDGCATEGLVIATYTALEMMARGAGDTGTAQLAADIRADEQRMLEWLRHEILKLTDPFIRDELDELDPIERPQRQRVPGKRVWADYDELSVGEVRHALSRSDARGHHETPRTFATGGPGNGSRMNDGDSPKDKVRKLEENPPERIEDWPDDEAKYETFGGPEGDHTYEEGPESKLGPSSLRHHEGGDVSIDGEKVEDPERYKGDPIPGGPTDPKSR